MKTSLSITVQDICKEYKQFSSPFERVKEAFHPFRKKYHKRFQALSNISFQVEKGDVVGIIGLNGSGKSTLLHLISGITEPTSGRILVNGRIAALLELGAGFNPEFTGRQNVYTCGSILGLSHREIDECFSEIVTFAEIGKFIDQPVKTYSSGLYLRLAFSLAINVRPDILVVDEALAVGDTLFQARCFAKFREFQRRGTTIILVTHSLDILPRLCNKACLLDGGKLITFDTPRQVLDAHARVILNHAGLDRKADTAQLPAGEDQATEIRHTSATIQRNPAEDRYGNGNATIEHIGIYTRDGRPLQCLNNREEYEFRVRVVFHAQIQNPVFSYRIRDSNGIDVAGTNTLYNNIATERFDPDERALITFCQKILLSSGEYFLSASCAGFEDGKYVVYDRRYNAIPFRVTGGNRSEGLVDLATEIRLTRNDEVSLNTQQ